MKIIAVWCLTLTLCLTLCACGTNSTNNLQGGDTADVNVLQNLLNEFDRTATITEKVLFDDKQIKITAKSIAFTDSEMTLDIEIANNTNSNLDFSCGSAACDVNSINKIMAADGFVSCDVAAGESVSEEIGFSINEMIAYGISPVANIDIGFWRCY